MNEEQILREYDAGFSSHEIAKKHNTYANKINRIIRKSGRKMRNHSEAQSLVLKRGISQHPTEGKERKRDVKERISVAVYNYWQNASEKAREKRSREAKIRWKEMTEEEKQNLKQAAAEGMRIAAKEGSKIEKLLLDRLERDGYIVEFHRKRLVENEDLELDFFLPEINTAIEIDGPTHFFPIWGEEVLQRTIKSDMQKSGLLIANGIAVIRIKYLSSNTSIAQAKILYEQLLPIIKKIEKKFPSKTERYIELEVPK